MMDDNLSDVQPSFISWKNNEGLSIPTYHCATCKTTTEGFSLCLKCNPQTYEVYDTQQEKKMSVEELRLSDVENMTDMNVRIAENKKFKIEIASDMDGDWLYLDRSQAHMLMLYLQQHLGYVSISKDRLDDKS